MPTPKRSNEEQLDAREWILTAAMTRRIPISIDDADYIAHHFLTEKDAEVEKAREEAAAEERNQWINTVGEKIDKTTRDLMLAAFNEGVQSTKYGYERAIQNIQAELDQDVSK